MLHLKKKKISRTFSSSKNPEKNNIIPKIYEAQFSTLIIFRNVSCAAN